MRVSSSGQPGACSTTTGAGPVWPCQPFWKSQSQQEDSSIALLLLVHVVTGVLQALCQGVDQVMEQRFQVFRAITSFSIPGGEPGVESWPQVARGLAAGVSFSEWGALHQDMTQGCASSASWDSEAGSLDRHHEAVTEASEADTTGDAKGETWQLPKRVARRRDVAKPAFPIRSRPKFFHVHDDEHDVQADPGDAHKAQPSEGAMLPDGFDWRALWDLIQKAGIWHPVPAPLASSLLAAAEEIETIFPEATLGYQVGWEIMIALEGEAAGWRRAELLVKQVLQCPSGASNKLDIHQAPQFTFDLPPEVSALPNAHTQLPKSDTTILREDWPNPQCGQCSGNAPKVGSELRNNEVTGIAPTRADRPDLKVGFANVTTLNQATLDWLGSCGCAAVGVQETHLDDEQLHARRGTLQALCWHTFGLPAHPGEKGFRLGGLVWVARRHRGAWHKHRFLHEGAGFEAIGLRAGGLDYTLIVLYLKDTEGPTGPRNAEILANLVSYVRSLPEPWVVGGDFNCSPEDLLELSMVQVMRGRLVATGEITCTQGVGAELDFVIVSRALEPYVSLEVEWCVPWRPHGALLLTIKQAGLADPQWRLQQFPKLTGDVSSEAWPSVEVSCAELMNHIGDDPVSVSLAKWAKAMESCRGSELGRGQRVQALWGRLSDIRVMNQSQNTAAGWWGRMRKGITRLQAGLRGDLWQSTRDNARDADAFLTTGYWSSEAEHFCTQVCDAFHAKQAEGLQQLAIQAQVREAEAQRNQSSNSLRDFRSWLKAGSIKGMRPLFRALSKAECVHSRPFVDQPVAERARLRRNQWLEIWGEAEPCQCLSETLNYKARSCQLQPITGLQISSVIHKVADKAGGLDGLTYAAIRSLPSQAYDSLAAVLNQAETLVQAPLHWTQNEVCMIPKKEHIERPITLTSVTYRIWCFTRRREVQRWMEATKLDTPWDRATPGNTCLQVAIHRLLKGEVSRHSKSHMICVLLDLETFYDRVDLEVLEQRLLDANFPPIVAALTLQTYRGARHIVSEDILSEPITPQRGILAGCPFATVMARVFLKPILQQASSSPGLKGLDTWVDDIGADFESSSPILVAQHALSGFRQLATLLEQSGLKLSREKTGFLASTKQARNALEQIKTDDDPKIFQSMRDLGVDCGLGRFRRVRVQTGRLLKGKCRKAKMESLKLTNESCRIRLFRGSISPSLMWGHQAQGMPPSRVKWLRRAVGQQVGLHKLGCLEVALAAMDHRVSDPWADILTQQVQSWFKALDRWGPDTAPIARVWEQAASAWHHVKGPLAATVGHMTGIRWNVSEAFVWQRPGQSQRYNIQDACQRTLVLQALKEDVRQEGRRQIAQKVGSPALEKGLDWVVGRKLLASFAAKGDTLKQTGLKAVWQGSLVHCANSPVKTCPKCNVEASWRHVLLDCQWWNDKGFSQPVWYSPNAELGPKLSWLRGLRSFAKVTEPSCYESTGLWLSDDIIDGRGLTFSTDASGGPFTSDVRLRKVGVSVAAFKWVNGKPELVASICATLPGQQTVFRGELYAVLLLLQRSAGPIDCTLDCKGVFTKLRGACQGKHHADLWEQVRQQNPQRLHAVWVNSHLTELEFVEKFGQQQAWRRDLNEVADKLCSDFANKLVCHVSAKALHAEDVQFKSTLENLSGRAAKILVSQGAEAHPCYQAFERLKADKKQEGRHSGHADLPRPCKKRFGANVGHGHTQTMQEWFSALVSAAGDVGQSGHKWEWQGLNIACSKCSLKLLHTKNRNALKTRSDTPCGGDGPASFAGVHQTHVMELFGQLWKCSQCGGQYSLTNEVTAKLSLQCTKKKDKRSQVK